ncbi:MAG: hypothetical protein ACUVXA_03225 [Candidatus Jordarchaeum sp.]|uniref:hypothetical protein n=1 Tax=Candidatus Jordarchaeum sp. TaxID=2823881 RepID=UPI00404A0BBD
MSKKIILERLKELLLEMESKEAEQLATELESCWVECWEKERDPTISQDLIYENRKILEQISIAIEVYQAGVINSKKLKEIKINLLKKES